jgi:hypothetical protein
MLPFGLITVCSVTLAGFSIVVAIVSVVTLEGFAFFGYLAKRGVGKGVGSCKST